MKTLLELIQVALICCALLLLFTGWGEVLALAAILLAIWVQLLVLARKPAS